MQQLQVFLRELVIQQGKAHGDLQGSEGRQEMALRKRGSAFGVLLISIGVSSGNKPARRSAAKFAPNRSSQRLHPTHPTS